MVAPTIGTLGGILATPIRISSELANGVAQQSDGKLVVVGAIAGNGGVSLAVMRYNTDGTLDETFDGDGILAGAIGALPNGSEAEVLIQTNGQILIAGSDANSKVAVVRLNTDGSLDTGFGTGGTLTTTIGANFEGGKIALQTDGKIVVMGRNPNNDDFEVARFDTNGTLDTSFDGDGIATTDTGTFEETSGVFFSPLDNTIIAIGGKSVARYDINGSLDATFDSDGIAFTPNNYFARDGVVQSDGQILVLSSFFDGNTGNESFSLLRYGTDGSLDTNFGTGGIADFPGGNSDIRTKAIALQADGKIVVISGIQGLREEAMIVRYNSDGTLDQSFGDGGQVILDTETGLGRFFGTFGAAPRDISIQSDGKIVVVGHFGLGDDEDFSAFRLNSDGTLDQTFALASFTEDESPTPVAPYATLDGGDKILLTTATVSISSGFQAGDLLHFTDQNGIFGDYNANTGVLTLTGLASVGAYEDALKSITFSSTSDDPDNGGSDPTRTISWQVADGADASAVQTSMVKVTGVDDAPMGISVDPVSGQISEDASTDTRTKVADINVTDADGGINELGLAGGNAGFFEIDGDELFLKAGANLDFESKETLKVRVTVDGDGQGGPDITSSAFTLNVGNVSPEQIVGTDNADNLKGGSDIDIIRGLDDNDTIKGLGSDDTLRGQAGDDKIFGGDDDDILQGSSGDDTLKGDNGMDVIDGGSHRDKLWGGANADTFDFNGVNESRAGSDRDIIQDLQRNTDTIDLKDIDAKESKAGDQKFKWIGTDAFSGKEGELRYKDNGAKVIVQGDVDGDATSDFEILVKVGSLSGDEFVF